MSVKVTGMEFCVRVGGDKPILFYWAYYSRFLKICITLFLGERGICIFVNPDQERRGQLGYIVDLEFFNVVSVGGIHLQGWERKQLYEWLENKDDNSPSSIGGTK